MAEEAGGKVKSFGERGKAACGEIWTAFKTLSTDAKIIVCAVFVLLVAGLFCGGSSGVAVSSSGEDVTASSLMEDVKNDLKEGYQKGLNDIKNDAEIQKDLEEVQKQCEKVGAEARKLNGALKGLGL